MTVRRPADNHHRRVDPAARAVGQQAEGVDADVEAVTQHCLESADADVERSGDRAGEQGLIRNCVARWSPQLESLRHDVESFQDRCSGLYRTRPSSTQESSAGSLESFCGFTDVWSKYAEAECDPRRSHGAVLDPGVRRHLDGGHRVAAAVSKQTVYKHFSDKQTLFREVALGSVQHVRRDFQSQVAAAAEATDVPAALQDLARSYVMR